MAGCDIYGHICGEAGAVYNKVRKWEESALTSTAGSSERRVYWLDELRGIAAICVVIQHGIWLSRPNPLEYYFDPGIFGVTIFFCISGFIVPHSINPQNSGEVMRFIISRVFRLYPAYWCSLLLAAVILSPSWRSILANITMLQKFLGVDDIIGSYWTLQVEILFYAILIGMILFRHLNNFFYSIVLMIFFATASMVLALGRTFLHYKFPIAPPIGLTFMLLCHSMALASERSNLKAKMLLTGAATFCILTATFLLGYSHNWGFGETPTRFMVSDSLAFILFVSYKYLPNSIPFFLFIGRISYSIYLVHEPILDVFMPYLQKSINTPICFVIVSLVIIFIAWLLNMLIERPFQRWGRTFALWVARTPRSAG
jgi:peptidoglycan/LPS O-acetylase OafA/YrhL